MIQGCLSSTPCLQELLGGVGKGRRGPHQPITKMAESVPGAKKATEEGLPEGRRGFGAEVALKARRQDSHLSLPGSGIQAKLVRSLTDTQIWPMAAWLVYPPLALAPQDKVQTHLLLGPASS